MIEIPHEFTLAAVKEQQFRIEYKCKLQYLKVLKDNACKEQQEYINIRNKLME